MKTIKASLSDVTQETITYYTYMTVRKSAWTPFLWNTLWLTKKEAIQRGKDYVYDDQDILKIVEIEVPLFSDNTDDWQATS